MNIIFRTVPEDIMLTNRDKTGARPPQRFGGSRQQSLFIFQTLRRLPDSRLWISVCDDAYTGKDFLCLYCPKRKI